MDMYIPTNRFYLSFNGGDAEGHIIDLYDVARAMIGFQRTLALTTHLIVNGEIITQAPALKNAKIYSTPPEQGSWKVGATIMVGGLYTLGATSTDTPIGHVVHSLYDYVVSESLGVHVNYDESIGQTLERYNEGNANKVVIDRGKADALTEKCLSAISEVHRPICANGSATSASIYSQFENEVYKIGENMDLGTYGYLNEDVQDDEKVIIIGRISSYNSNTYKGRIYVPDEQRPVTFELLPISRTPYHVSLITASLAQNAQRNYDDEWCDLYLYVQKVKSKSGQLKRYIVTDIRQEP